MPSQGLGYEPPAPPLGPGGSVGTVGEARGWRFAPFRRLAFVQFVHGAGDALVAVALADTLFFSVPLGEARDQVALYLALTMAPFAVLSPLVGPWLDRRRGSYRLAIVAGMVGRAVLAGLLSGRTDRLELYPLAFGLLVWSRVHGVSRSALVPEALPPGRALVWANAWLAVVSVAGGAAGAAPGAALNRFVGTDATLVAAAAVFAAGTLGAIDLPGAQPGAPRRERVADYRRLLAPRLLAGGVAMAASRAAVGFVVFLLAFLLRAEGAEGAGLAAVAVAGAAGGFVGSALAPALRRWLREPALLLGALGVVAVAAAWGAPRFGLPTAAVVAAAVGFGSGAGRLAFDSLLQTDAPEEVRGRAFSRYETIFQLCWVAGAGLATAVPFRPTPGLATLAAICLVGLVLSARGLLHGRRVRRVGPPPEEVRADEPEAPAAALPVEP